MSSPDEVIVFEIIRSGKKAELNAAIKYLRSVSARAEAEMINVSDVTQHKIILAISRLRVSDLKNYSTQSLIASINSILGKMISNCELLARRMITANILLGKLKSGILGTVISPALLNDADKSRIDKMVADNTNDIRRGASLTMASVNAMIQRLAIRSNMPVTKSKIGEKDNNENKKDDDTHKQEPISNEFEGMFIEPKRPSSILLQKMPTEIELSRIRENPKAFVDESVKLNTETIVELRNDYSERIAKNNRILSAKGGTGTITGIVRELLMNGISAFTDKGGHCWSLVNYCSMSARTASTKSNNIGEVFADEVHDLYYIVPHSHSCPLCARVEGKVYSRSGKDPRFPALASIFSKIDPAGTDDLDNTYMVIHPNCRHKIIKYFEPSETR